MSVHATWRVEVVEGHPPATDVRGVSPLEHAEWVRMLLGACLAPVRLAGGSESPRVEYLVAGAEVSEQTPPAVRESMRAAVAADLARLRAALGEHRTRIRDASEKPDRFDAMLFLDAYELLMATTVSDDPAHWVLTDEGLCVTRWGLAEGPRHRPLLTWSDDDIARMQADIERRLGQLPAAEVPDLGSKVTWEALKAALRQEARRASDVRVRKAPAPSSPRPAPSVQRPAPVAAQRARALREWVIIAAAALLSVSLLAWGFAERWGRQRADGEAKELRIEVDRQRGELEKRMWKAAPPPAPAVDPRGAAEGDGNPDRGAGETN